MPASTPPAFSRRDFLTAVGAAGVVACLPRQLAAAPAAPAPTTIHAFAKPLQWLDYEALASLYKETGYGGIDYAVRPGGHVLPERVADDLPRAVAAARQAGLQVEMITTAILDPRDRHTEPILQAAAAAGVKYYRLGSLGYDAGSPAETWKKFRPALRDLAAMNAQYGLHGAYQNHVGTHVGGPVLDLYNVLEGLDPRWIGCQYDIRHATAEGGTAWPIALRLLAPWIRCTDIKDFHWAQSVGKASPETVPLGDGIVNFEQYFKLVRELKITGPMSVHFEYPPFERDIPKDPTERRRACAAAMRQDREVLAAMMAKYGVA